MCESEEGEGAGQTVSSRYVHQGRALFLREQDLDGERPKFLSPKLC